MGILRQFLRTALTACLPPDRLLVRGPRRRVGRPKLALTFDDGPHPEYTPELLDRLDQLQLRATFFVIGNRAAQHHDLIRRIAAAGHELANHTYTHSEPAQTATSRFLDEVRRTDELLLSITGQCSRTVRPPKGELTLSKLRGLWQLQKTVALWNVDPKDFHMRNSAEMSQWCDAYLPQDGDIVLFHDNQPYAISALNRLAARGVFDTFDTITINDWISATTQPTAALA